MTTTGTGPSIRVPLSRSQRNIYNGVVQDGDPALYLIGRRYRFQPLRLPELLSALDATIRANPVHLCVLEPGGEDGYPALAPRLRVDELVRVCTDDATDTAAQLKATWAPGLLGVPLVRYIVRTDDDGAVCGLDAYCHHLLLDGGGTAIIEGQLGGFLSGDAEFISSAEGLRSLEQAHRREAALIDDALQRLTAATTVELRADTENHRRADSRTPGHAARGVPTESVVIDGADYAALLAACQAQRVPLNVLVAAAATAVDAGERGGTDALLVHAIDNRFGEPDLDVASCLVNSVPQQVRFAPFASVGDLVRSMDRGYVKALRRRWLREERYRRMYLAINRATGVDALTLNYLPQPCAPSLRPFLAEPPLTTDIGPIEGRTVAAIADEAAHRLQIAIWDRADLPTEAAISGIAEQIATVLKSFAANWDRPVAMTVGKWQVLTTGGTLAPGADAAPEHRGGPAWFTSGPDGLTRRPHLLPWLAWLEENQAVPGEVLVVTDDGTDRTVDLVLAGHLSGCPYCPCDSARQAEERAARIAETGIGVRIIDPAAVRLGTEVDATTRVRIDARLEIVAADPDLGERTAYLMPTSGTTGEAKLVEVKHRSLAAFCAGIAQSYGWGPTDTVLQCAPLTSDISVEEIFGAVRGGAALIRSAATRTGDLPALTRDVVSSGATVLDLPTALWHLLCEDPDAIAAIGGSRLRQVIIGGEPVRGTAVDRWVESPATRGVSLISTYGPTETTVIVSLLPLAGDGAAGEPTTRSRVGRPLLPDTVFVAFGEIVVVGDPVAAGYLGRPSVSFGTVVGPDGMSRPVFATGDRVRIVNGHPVFAGRRDALVKISGRRVDTAAIGTRIGADTAIVDLAVEVSDGALGVWFCTPRTHGGDDDPPVAARIRGILASSGVASFFVVGVPGIPRKPSGKVDRTALPQPPGCTEHDPVAGGRAVALAALWSGALGRPIGTGSSLLEEGIGSLDLIKILPPTRRLLGWQLSIFDLISADTAAELAAAAPRIPAEPDPATVAEIDRDMSVWESRRTRRPAGEPVANRTDTVVVLGASGILGRGFAEAVLAARRAGTPLPDVVLAMRSALPDGDPWESLAGMPGVRLERMPDGFGPAEVDALLCDTGATTLVNCIGSANMLVPYADLRPANLDIVPVTIDACLRRAVSLVHLSTSVVVDQIGARHVVDPRRAPYPYAAVKALAEVVVAGAPDDLDFTMVRLPRILGEPDQLVDSSDILVSMVDACAALGVRPRLVVREEVTTGRAAAQSILRRLPGPGGPRRLGRDITALRGTVVDYSVFLADFAPDELDVADWKRRLDDSGWARANPGRWSIIDAWLSLGTRLDGRDYGEFLAESPSIDLDVRSVTQLDAPPADLRELCATTSRLIFDGPRGAYREGITP